MSSLYTTSGKSEFDALIQAVLNNTGEPTLGQMLTRAQWDVLATYMQPGNLTPGQVLIKQRAEDRTLYFVESGMLTVHFEDGAGKIHLASVGGGSVLGEGGFFSQMARSATVQAGSACKLWSLSPMRFTEMSNRQPLTALALAMALGAIMAKRVVSNRKRITIA